MVYMLLRLNIGIYNSSCDCSLTSANLYLSIFLAMCASHSETPNKFPIKQFALKVILKLTEQVSEHTKNIKIYNPVSSILRVSLHIFVLRSECYFRNIYHISMKLYCAKCSVLVILFHEYSPYLNNILGIRGMLPIAIHKFKKHFDK